MSYEFQDVLGVVVVSIAGVLIVLSLIRLAEGEENE